MFLSQPERLRPCFPHFTWTYTDDSLVIKNASSEKGFGTIRFVSVIIESKTTAKFKKGDSTP